MACEIFPKNITNKVRNTFLDKFDTARPSKGGLSAILSGVNISTIQQEVDAINKSFHSDKYGEVAEIKKLGTNSYEVLFKAPQELLDAMNLQVTAKNINETRGTSTAFESARNNSLEDSFLESSRNQINSEVPIEGNPLDYLRHKEAILWKVNKKLRELQKDSRNPRYKGDTLVQINENRSKLLTLQKQLEHQIQTLKAATPLEVYNIILADINNLSQDLDTSENSGTLRERLDFINLLVTGTSYDKSGDPITPYTPVDDSGNEAYPEVKKELMTQIAKLNLKFAEKQHDVREDILNEDILYRQAKENYISGLDSDLTPQQKEEAWKRAITPTEDINWLEKTFLGIAASSVNNGVVPQVILSQFKRQSVLRDAEVKVYLDRLKILIQKFDKNETFDWIFELTASGNKTGNIISKYSDAYQKALNVYYSIGKKDSQTDINLTEEVIFKEKLEWLSNNADIIDFTMLPEIYEVYHTLYPEHFTASAAEMQQYSDKLKQELGPVYESEVNKILTSLQTFQIEQEALLANTNDPFRYKKIAENNLWAFMMNVKSGKGSQKVDYSTGMNTESVYSNLRGLPFIPKRNKTVGVDAAGNIISKDTGFYNKAFEDGIEKDPLKFEYWEVMKDIYTEYINPTYSDKAENMSYAKFEKTWLENLSKVKGIKKGSTFIQDILSQYASYFYEKGYVKSKEGVKRNYADMSNSDAYRLKDVLSKLPLVDIASQAKELSIDTTGMDSDTRAVREKAKERVVAELAKTLALQEYSTDINKVTEALLYMASSMKAREDVAATSRLLAASERAKHPDRKQANDKLDEWIDRMIFNETEKYTGKGTSFLGAEFTKNEIVQMIFEKIETIPVVNKYINSQTLKKLTPNERKIYESLTKLKEGKTGSDYSFKDGDITYHKVTIDGEVRYVESVEVENEFGVTTPVVKDITEQEFDEASEIYISEMASNLGLDLSLAGFIQGILKTIIFKGLALNPISGLFNRIEGKTSALVMDETGQYWTPGNIHKANTFLEFANAARMTSYSSKLPMNKDRIANLEIMEKFIQQVNIIQNRKNELERASDNNERYIVGEEALFIPAVDNPEYKNQGGILLAILMDTKIMNKETGEMVPIFNGKEFTAWELVDGVIRLKPEFATESNMINWENFSINENDINDNQFFTTLTKVESAIATSQGNYDSKDTIGATRNIWGRAFTVFMKWLPSHVLQRFSSGEGIDLFNNGEKAIKGRYRYLSSSFSSGLSAFTASSLLFFGVTPVTLAVGGSLTAILAFKAFSKATSDSNIKREILSLHEFLGFTKAMVISTVNYPLEMFNSKHVLKADALDKFIPGYNKATNLTTQEVQNLQAVAKEIGIRLAYIAVLLLLKKLTWDDDDEKDAKRRQFHNFVDNQLTRGMESVSDYSSPTAMWDNVSRLAFISYLQNMSNTLESIVEVEPEKMGDGLLKASPIPRIAYKGGTPGLNLVLDEKEYKSDAWYDETIKKSGVKNKYDTYVKDKMKTINDKNERKGLVGEYLEEQNKKDKKAQILSKSKTLTYRETLDIINSTTSIEKQRKKQKNLVDKKKREEKLNKK